jgi:hypothetical protein
LSFPLRKTVPETVLRVLTSAANGREVAPEDVQDLHPVPRWYLSDAHRLVADDELEPIAGTPLRLFRGWEATGFVHLTIEIAMHDDVYAGGGWVLPLWLYLLAEPPTYGVLAIGHRSLYRNDARQETVHLHGSGDVAEGDLVFTREQMASGIGEAGITAWP